MEGDHTATETFLLVRAGTGTWAIPCPYVQECTRPLAIRPLADMPDAVLGLAVVRGGAVPVLDLGRLLDGQPSAARRRFVILKIGARKVAALVGDVLGVSRMESRAISDLPPLLQSGDQGAIERIGLRDEGVIGLLRCSRIIPDSVMDRLDPHVEA